jgi:predicted permease
MTPAKILQVLLGLLVSLAFMGSGAALMFYAVPTENRETLIQLLGQLSGAFTAIMGFVFGSSLGSQRKDELLNPTPESK